MEDTNMPPTPLPQAPIPDSPPKPTSLTSVPLTKLIIFMTFLCLTLTIIGFVIGMKYQQSITINSQQSTIESRSNISEDTSQLSSEEKNAQTITSEPTILPTKQPSQTDSWTEVVNPIFGYTIKYPADKYENCFSSNGELRLFIKPFTCPTAGDPIYQIGVITIPKDSPVYNWEHSTPEKTEQIVIGGKAAIKKYYTYGPEDGPLASIGSEVYVEIETDNGKIQINADAQNQIILSDFNLMLSTLRFSNR